MEMDDPPAGTLDSTASVSCPVARTVSNEGATDSGMYVCSDSGLHPQVSFSSEIITIGSLLISIFDFIGL